MQELPEKKGTYAFIDRDYRHLQLLNCLSENNSLKTIVFFFRSRVPNNNHSNYNLMLSLRDRFVVVRLEEPRSHNRTVVVMRSLRSGASR